MRNFFLTMVIGCGLGVAGASALPSDTDQTNYHLGLTWPWSHGLQEEINHLNRMRGHVRWQLRNYKGNREVRRDFFRVSHDIDGINSRFRADSSNRRQLRRDVERAHGELHRIEIALRVKERDLYPWR